MDVILATTTVVATVAVPIPISHEPKGSSVCRGARGDSPSLAYGILVTEIPLRAALFLSLCLFSLGLLEVVPNAWLIMFDNNIDFEPESSLGRLLTLTGAYRFLMWAEVFFFCVVFPSAAATICLLRLSAYWNAVGETRSRSNIIVVVLRVIHLLGSTISIVFGLVTATIRFIFMRTLGRNGAHRRPLPRSESLAHMANSKKKNLPNPSRSFDQTLETQTSRRLDWIRVDIITTLHACIGTLLGVACSYSILNTLGKFVVYASTTEELVYLNSIISKLSAIGILISSALNGFGCVSMPYTCLSGLYLEDINPETVTRAEVDLQYVIKAIEEKRIALADLKQNCRSAQSDSQDNFSGSLQDCCRSRAEPSREETVIRSVMKEIDFLETLGEEIENDIEDMVRDQKAAVMSSTLMGRIMARLGIIFSIILLVRVASAVLTITQSVVGNQDSFPSTRADPVTLGLIWLIGHNIVSEDQYNSISQCASLLLTVCLSISQVRTFLRTMKTLFLRLRCSTRESDWAHTSKNNDSVQVERPKLPPLQGSYSNALASLMGCYFLSCAVSIKKNLPLEYRSAFSIALSGFDFEFDIFIINFVFAASACASTLILLLLFGIRRQNSRRRTFVAPENIANLNSNV